MRKYYGWIITQNKECKKYPWNIYNKKGDYICSCVTLKEAKDCIKENMK